MKEILSREPEITIYHSDAVVALEQIQPNSIDCMVTDPPAGIGLLGKSWDSFGQKNARNNFVGWLSEIFAKCFEVLKPGAHVLVWAYPKTSHWTALALEEAGFEPKDRITHFVDDENLLQEFINSLDEQQLKLFALLIEQSRVEHIQLNGYPKGMNIASAIEAKIRLNSARSSDWKKLDGIPTKSRVGYHKIGYEQGYKPRDYSGTPTVRVIVKTPEAKKWFGWYTTLRPAMEDWWLFYKPFEKGLTNVDNILKWGVGGLNLKDTAIQDFNSPDLEPLFEELKDEDNQIRFKGKYPTNVIFDDSENIQRDVPLIDNEPLTKYYYCVRASLKEKNEGVKKNSHPTVKPIQLMEYLIKLVCPANGIVLDPFMGSGSTGLACLNLKRHFVGIEKDETYFNIAKDRILFRLKRREYEHRITNI